MFNYMHKKAEDYPADPYNFTQSLIDQAKDATDATKARRAQRADELEQIAQEGAKGLSDGYRGYIRGVNQGATDLAQLAVNAGTGVNNLGWSGIRYINYPFIAAQQLWQPGALDSWNRHVDTQQAGASAQAANINKQIRGWNRYVQKTYKPVYGENARLAEIGGNLLPLALAGKVGVGRLYNPVKTFPTSVVKAIEAVPKVGPAYARVVTSAPARFAGTQLAGTAPFLDYVFGLTHVNPTDSTTTRAIKNAAAYTAPAVGALLSPVQLANYAYRTSNSMGDALKNTLTDLTKSRVSEPTQQLVTDTGKAIYGDLKQAGKDIMDADLDIREKWDRAKQAYARVAEQIASTEGKIDAEDLKKLQQLGSWIKDDTVDYFSEPDTRQYFISELPQLLASDNKKEVMREILKNAPKNKWLRWTGYQPVGAVSRNMFRRAVKGLPL